jgi:hypothetical protein
MLVVLVGAAVIASQFLFNKKDGDIALRKEQEKTSDDTVQSPAATSDLKSLQDSDQAVASDTSINPPISRSEVPQQQEPAEEKSANQPARLVKPGQLTTSPSKQEEKEVSGEKPAITTTRDEVKVPATEKIAKETDAGKQKADVQGAVSNKKTEPVASRTMEKSYRAPSRLNIFRGRVTDDNNRGLPFANVTNVSDQVGTYADASGYFSLTSPDSVLDVQVRSLGYDNKTLQLRNSNNTNTVVMKDNTDDVAEVMLSRSNSNAKRRQAEDYMKVEEPEPADGWENYDVYLANNLNIPLDYEPKTATPEEVELSFEVDKSGNPTNIRVERSLCKTCDEEAIRLVKEGPKWKRKTKRRTRVTITF